MHAVHKVAGRKERRLKGEKGPQCQAKEFHLPCLGEREPFGISRKILVSEKDSPAGWCGEGTLEVGRPVRKRLLR